MKDFNKLPVVEISQEEWEKLKDCDTFVPLGGLIPEEVKPHLKDGEVGMVGDGVRFVVEGM